MRVRHEVKVQVAAEPDGQLSKTGSDARSMATSGRGSGIDCTAGMPLIATLQISVGLLFDQVEEDPNLRRDEPPPRQQRMDLQRLRPPLRQQRD